jgi:ankyrin repeat protein
MLLHHGANVNAFFRGRTPVMRALKYSSSAVLKLLLESPRLDIDIQNRDRESALWCAVTYGSFSTLRPILKPTDCAVDLRHQRGQTALHLALWWGKIGLAELLL